MADKSDVTNKTIYQNSNDLYSNNLETETIQRVENENGYWRILGNATVSNKFWYRY